MQEWRRDLGRLIIGSLVGDAVLVSEDERRDVLAGCSCRHFDEDGEKVLDVLLSNFFLGHFRPVVRNKNAFQLLEGTLPLL